MSKDITNEQLFEFMTNITKVPGSTRLLSKLVNEIKKNPKGESQRGSFLFTKLRFGVIIDPKICIVFYIE